ncbi:MAG TPA: 6,7-dimethyl-8-ribityllumazine synthase [candidate division Zixibacteria bacterium]|jgi:6,7-dimethyl-8-ribityllumazine synthase
MSVSETIEGRLDARDLRFGIVVSRFNSVVTDQLLSGALDTLRRHGAAESAIVVVKVPGAFELPGVVRRISQIAGFHAVIALGAIIRGETPHFDYIASAVTKGIADIAQRSAIPVLYGVLTTDTVQQAIDRAGGKSGNKGADAAVAAIEMADVQRRLTSVS